MPALAHAVARLRRGPALARRFRGAGLAEFDKFLPVEAEECVARDRGTIGEKSGEQTEQPPGDQAERDLHNPKPHTRFTTGRQFRALSPI